MVDRTGMENGRGEGSSEQTVLGQMASPRSTPDLSISRGPLRASCLFHCHHFPSSTMVDLGRDGYWGCMEEIVTSGHSGPGVPLCWPVQSVLGCRSVSGKGRKAGQLAQGEPSRQHQKARHQGVLPLPPRWCWGDQVGGQAG